MNSNHNQYFVMYGNERYAVRERNIEQLQLPQNLHLFHSYYKWMVELFRISRVVFISFEIKILFPSFGFQ